MMLKIYLLVVVDLLPTLIQVRLIHSKNYENKTLLKIKLKHLRMTKVSILIIITASHSKKLSPMKNLMKYQIR